MADIKFSVLTQATDLGVNDIFALAQDIGGGDLRSRGTTTGKIASKIVNDIDFVTDLDTTNKKITGAINELAARKTYIDVTGTLTAGQTSITLQATEITTTSNIDIYTDVFGIQPTNAVVATGSITLTFLAQASDITVKVRVS